MALGIIAGVIVAGGLLASDITDGPAEEAVLPESAARALAHQALPGGTIIETELEEDDGRLVYEFEMEAPRGIFEVEIDAVSGRVIEVELEDE